MNDLKQLLTLMVKVKEGNLGDTDAEFVLNVSRILNWDADRTKRTIREAANSASSNAASSSPRILKKLHTWWSSANT